MLSSQGVTERTLDKEGRMSKERGSQCRGDQWLPHQWVTNDSRGLFSTKRFLQEFGEITPLQWDVMPNVSSLFLVSCSVDVSTLGMDSLHVKRTSPRSHCEMKVNSVLKEDITLTSKANMSFQDCLPEDVQITAKASIGKSTFQCWAAVSRSGGLMIISFY